MEVRGDVASSLVTETNELKNKLPRGIYKYWSPHFIIVGLV